MEDRDSATATPRFMLAACAAGFFWLYAAQVLTGFLDFMVKDQVGSRSGMVGNIDAAINGVLVAPLGGPLAAAVLFVAGIGAAWLVARTPRQDIEKEVRRDEAVPNAVPAHPIAPNKAGFGKRTAAMVCPASDSHASPVRTEVWLSSVLSNHDIGMKQGTHTKFYNHAWDPASFEIPTEPDEVYAACRRYREGHALQRSDFPEAIAVFDEKRFAKRRDLFFAGPFFTVQGKLAEVLSHFDLGDGGLIPFAIYGGLIW